MLSTGSGRSLARSTPSGATWPDSSREREAYRRRGEIEAAPVPERPPDGEIRELERVQASEADPGLVEALAAYLYRNPRRSDETPSWLAVTLWADELVEGKPTPAAVEVALASPSFRAVAA